MGCAGLLGFTNPWSVLQSSVLSLAQNSVDLLQQGVTHSPIQAFMEEQCTYKVEALVIWYCSVGTGFCLSGGLWSHPGGMGFGRPL